MKKDNILIYALIAIGAFYFIHKKGENTSGEDTNLNFSLLKTNLNIKSQNPVLVVSFNAGKNRAQFYNNDRVIILDSNLKRINAGKYSNGGLSIALDNGKTIESDNVVLTLNKSLI